MRVLPYFQSVNPSRTAQAVRADRSDRPRQALAPVENAPMPVGEDRFVPTSIATGVVFSIKNDTPGGSGISRAEGQSRGNPGIVKSGSYRFYRLDGLTETGNQPARGKELDLRG